MSLNLPWGTTRYTPPRADQLVLSQGLYILFQWIEQRRREINEYRRQYAENMMKSTAVLWRRISMRHDFARNYSVNDTPLGPVPKFMHKLLYGVPGTTRGWLQPPDHSLVSGAAWDYATMLRDTASDEITPGVNLVTGKRYYLPGL